MSLILDGWTWQEAGVGWGSLSPYAVVQEFQVSPEFRAQRGGTDSWEGGDTAELRGMPTRPALSNANPFLKEEIPSEDWHGGWGGQSQAGHALSQQP